MLGAGNFSSAGWLFQHILNYPRFMIATPFFLFTSVLLTVKLQSIALNPVATESIIQGVIWTVLGVFILQNDTDISLQTMAT